MVKLLPDVVINTKDIVINIMLEYYIPYISINFTAQNVHFGVEYKEIR